MRAETEIAAIGEDAVPLVQVRSVRWYRHWIFATVMLCCYGFFKEFKPSEPFLTPYLTSEIKNFTKDEVQPDFQSKCEEYTVVSRNLGPMGGVWIKLGGGPTFDVSVLSTTKHSKQRK